ncbi:MAG: alkaline phosphatase PhoX, partial [Verrucomicrobiota bacterium]
MFSADSSRRCFLRTLGGSVILSAAHRAGAAWLTRPEPVSASSSAPAPSGPWDRLDVAPVASSTEDRVVVPAGMKVEVLLRQGDRLNPAGDRYGDHNDYLALLPGPGGEGWAWCNHESVSLPVIAGVWKPPLTAAQAAECLKAMGGSAFRIRRDERGRWRPVVPDPRNFRLDGLSTRLRLTGPAAGSGWVQRARSVVGSTSNCGGGITPWGTVCSGEENFQDLWG